MLPLVEPDPAKQLARIHEHAQELKDSHQGAVELVNALHEWVPFDLQGMSSDTQNTIVTKVPGPQYPLYLLGGELLACTRSRP